MQLFSLAGYIDNKQKSFLYQRHQCFSLFKNQHCKRVSAVLLADL